MTCERCSRRTVLLGALGLGACGQGGQPGETDAGAATPGCSALTADEVAGAVQVDWAEVPALGGSSYAVVERPDQLLNVWVHRDDAGCFSAVWRVCTHGACEVVPSDGGAYECPCHGSRFALDGAVLRGPATRGLRAYRVSADERGLQISRG